MVNEYKKLADILDEWDRKYLFGMHRDIVKTALDRAYDIVIWDCIDILARKAEEAAINTEEFSEKIFLDALQESIYNFGSNLFEFLIENWVEGDGSFSGITVKIDLANHLGTLADYIEGVEMARENFAMDSTPAEASAFWKFIYELAHDGIGLFGYSESALPEMWLQTVTDRTTYFSTPAPFWNIINYGTGLDFGRGGTPHPSYGPSYFVESAEVDCAVEFQRVYSDQYIQLIEEVENKDWGYVEPIDPEPPYKPPTVLKRIKTTAQKVFTGIKKLFRR